MKKIIVTLTLLTLTSCASVNSVNYLSPDISSLSDEPYSIQVDKNYDETWNILVDYSDRTFFDIDDFEKSSGTMTLSFKTNDISDYVTGGHYSTSDVVKFKGDYADFLERNNGELTGRINLVVEEIDENSTSITVKARYVVSAETEFYNTWAFNTNGFDSEKISEYTGGRVVRTLMPTHNLEKEILSEFE